MRRARAKFRNAVPLILAAVVACDDGGPGNERILAPESPATRVAAARGFLTGWSSRRISDLQPLLESEQARLAIAQARGNVMYDSVTQEWERFRTRQQENAAASAFPFCRPLPYAGRVLIVGAEGGTVNVGPHTLRIPRGALSQYTVVTVEAPVSNYVELRLSPHGLQFLEEPTLLLSYRHCSMPHAEPYRLAYVDANGNVLEWPSSYDRSRRAELVGWIRQLSRHVVVQHTFAPPVIKASNYEPKRGYTPAGG